MSAEASLDLRLPIGYLFVALGIMLGGFGLVTNGDSAMYVKSAGLNINLIWGLVMLLTGAVFLLLAWRAAARP